MPLTSGLPVSRLVQVDVTLTAPAIVAPAINTCMLLGTSDVIDSVERSRTYGNISEVATDFGTTAEEYLAADLWFSQSPSPDNLYIGRWVNADSAGALIGAPLPPSAQLMSTWTSITDGAFKVTFDGGAETEVSGITFATLTNLNAVAAAISAAIGEAGAIVWNANADRFELRSATTGDTSSVSFLTAPTSGTDLSLKLAMQVTSSGAYAVPGQVAETALAAVAKLDAMFSSQWYALVCPSADDEDHQQIAAYCEAADPPHYYGVTTDEAGSLVSTSITDIGYILMNFGYNKSAVQFSNSSPYAIMSYLARILTTQWHGQNTAITLMYKQEPGVQPENLSTNEANVLQNKNINVYTNYANGARIIEYGTSCSGQFTDTIIGADALAADLQTDLFNVLYTTPTKIPQTDPGMTQLMTAAAHTCSGYVGNGWLAAGTWTAQGFGTLKTGDLLTLGFYIYAPSMLLQSPADRAARKAPLMQIAAKIAGAIHTAEVVVYVNQ